MKQNIIFFNTLFILLYLSNCGSDTLIAQNSQEDNSSSEFFSSTTSKHNQSAYITSQCYTKTIDANGKAHNPCFSCHINSKAPNYIDDPDLQESYDMSEYSKVNRFTNLFKDRSNAVAKISDEEILTYIRKDNYKENARLLLADKLTHSLPKEWDVNNNGKWDGYTPDCYFNFDHEGFDKDLDGNDTGWRAFGYYPFLGTFWPTNGSMDDVLIRLPEEFRKDESGVVDVEVYKINLSIVEALIKQKDVSLEINVDENKYGVDLDQDGNLSIATKVVFKWIKPQYDTATQTIQNFSMSYVGRAKALLLTNEVLIAPGLYPNNTEFLHSVRYIDIDENSTTIKMAARMKELRYGKKTSWNSYPQLYNASMAEIKEKDAFPNRLRTILGDSEQGLQTGLGWVYQGFIEDINGNLRPQNYEETQYCIGCHSGIGAIADSTFVFQRKFDTKHFQKGWYHWSQDKEGLKNITEPKTKDGRYEYTLYLEKNGAGDEFRSNMEVINKFFDNGTLKNNEVEKLHNDISHLLYPSTPRALELNKAYRVIVDEQSFIYGRDAHVKPIENVHKEVEEGESTGVEAL
ncbi:MAG: hypothetical protein U9N49_05875 [Campylobacterota bacterium]|nr:hypothetical protein [Campylobacterota bacterium]